MTFPVDGTIPGPNDLLSQSQGQIKTNFNNILGWSAVDHIQYGATHAGQHAQVTFPATTAPAAPSLLSSVLYSTAGSASASTAELFFKNSSITLLATSIKAFGTINGTTGALLNGFNAATAQTGTGVYTITITSGAISGANYAVLISTSFPVPGLLQNYVISGSVVTVSVINRTGVAINPTSLSFTILQY